MMTFRELEWYTTAAHRRTLTLAWTTATLVWSQSGQPVTLAKILGDEMDGRLDPEGLMNQKAAAEAVFGVGDD
jgi:hypothetical protein